MPRLQHPEDLATTRQQLLTDGAKYDSSVTMCAGTACQACGCLPVAKAMETELARQNLADVVRFRTTGCHGFCEQGPLAIVEPGNVFYRHIRAEDVEAIVSRTLSSGDNEFFFLGCDLFSGKLSCRGMRIQEFDYFIHENPFHDKKGGKKSRLQFISKSC